MEHFTLAHTYMPAEISSNLKEELQCSDNIPNNISFKVDPDDPETVIFNDDWFYWYSCTLLENNAKLESSIFNLGRRGNIVVIRNIALTYGALGMRLYDILRFRDLRSSPEGIAKLNQIASDYDLSLQSRFSVLPFRDILLHYLGLRYQPPKLIEKTLNTYHLSESSFNVGEN